MAINKYAAFYAAYNKSIERGNPLTKEEQVKTFTKGRTKSLQDLSYTELRELVTSLNYTNENKWKPTSEDDVKRDKMRKAIIAIYKDMHRTTQSAIAWAEKQGVKGVKKRFNDYTTQELYLLITVAEKVRDDWKKSIANKVKNYV
jgi:hypothetical protein